MTPIRRIPDDDNSTFTERPGRTSGGQSSQLSRISPRAHATHGDRVCTVPSDEGGEKDASIHVVARGGGCRRGRVFGGSGAGGGGGGGGLERRSDNDPRRRQLRCPSFHIHRPNAASPYPSNIVVSGLAGTVTDINVTLRGFTHDYPKAADVLLVGPGGPTILMADSGGPGFGGLSNVKLTFDDAAAPPHFRQLGPAKPAP